jgi:hypothetical protein
MKLICHKDSIDITHINNSKTNNNGNKYFLNMTRNDIYLKHDITMERFIEILKFCIKSHQRNRETIFYDIELSKVNIKIYYKNPSNYNDHIIRITLLRDDKMSNNKLELSSTITRPINIGYVALYSITCTYLILQYYYEKH